MVQTSKGSGVVWLHKCILDGESITLKEYTWVDAMVDEYKSIVKNNIWEVVPRPVDKSILGMRRIFKVKQTKCESTKKYKARFVAKGCSQVEGIDYEETFSPVARYSSIISILALVA